MLVRPLILGLAGLLLLAACSDSDDGQGPVTSPATTLAATSTTTGTGLPTTSTRSTSTTDATTSTSSTTTSTSTTAVTSTTAGDADAIGGLTLTHSGVGPLRFGASEQAAAEYLTGALGQPTTDTGWISSFSVYGTCPGSEIRALEWPGVVMLLGDADDEYSDGGRHFMSWIVGWQGPDPFGLETAEGIGVGDPRADVVAAYPNADVFEADDPFPPGFRDERRGEHIYGTFSDQGNVFFMTAGTECGE